MTRGDRETLSCWIIGELCPSGQSVSAMLEAVFLCCRDRNIYGPSSKELERLVRSQRQQYLDGWLQEVSAALPPETVAAMESSPADAEGPTGLNAMKGDAGRATLDNILEVTARLAFIRKLNLPRNMFSNINPTWIEHVARRVSGEKASEMRRHTETRQLALYAVYLMARETAMTDAMVELLVETAHKIGTRSKRKVVTDIAKDVERVYGKERLLVDIATASIDDPDGRICDVIFPVLGKESWRRSSRRAMPRARSTAAFMQSCAIHGRIIIARCYQVCFPCWSSGRTMRFSDRFWPPSTGSGRSWMMGAGSCRRRMCR